jgi:hypothetical protein
MKIAAKEVKIFSSCDLLGLKRRSLFATAFETRRCS